jgi:hypothetical protein
VQGSFTLLNSILSCDAGETNVFGSIIDAGYNLNSDATGVLTNVADLNGIDPCLGPLGNYGGPTSTIPLLAGSPAINAADPASYPATDQRGHPRPYGAGPDIGAFESSPPYVISGNVSGLSAAEGVLVSVGTNGDFSTAQGYYTISGFAPGTYTVSAQSQSYWFAPPSLTVTLTADDLAVDFAAYHGSLLNLANLANGALSLEVGGPGGQSLRIQCSADLIHWTSISTNTFGGANSLEVLLPTNGPVQFYRVLTP